MAPLIGIQKNAMEAVKLLKIAARVVDQMQEWIAKYPNALVHFQKKDKIFLEIDRVQLIIHLHNYSLLGAQLVDTMAIYNWLHNGFDSLT